MVDLKTKPQERSEAEKEELRELFGSNHPMAKDNPL